ncbi:MAG TPA: tetratricopeptide repeat protein [Actinospica sp.]|nr:tetratricopeptide repeat protein [Actinospica sp.]
MQDACRESDGLGDPRAEAEGELAVARLHLDVGDARHAAVHVAQALHYDPSFEDCYALLDALGEHAADDAELADWFRIGEPIYIGAAAALAALRAGVQQYAGAVDLLGVITAGEPGKPWCAAPWFGPHLADHVPPRVLAGAVGKFNTKLGDPAPAETVATFAPWLELARAAAAQPEITAQPLAVLSGLARRIGKVDEAITWCERAEAMDVAGVAEGEYRVGAVMLGFALRSAERPREAIEAWRRALRLDPDNIDLHIDLAETCMQGQDYEQAVAWADLAAERDPRHLKPQAVRLAALHALSDYTDNVSLASLRQLARENPEHVYPRRLIKEARRARCWIGGVPWPTEAMSRLLDRMLEGRLPSLAPYTDVLRISVSGLESPSPAATLRACFPRLAVEMLDLAPKASAPDMRAPASAAFGEPPWRYQGSQAFAAADPPDAAAVHRLRLVAESGNWNDPLDAHDRAAELRGLTAQELLGLVTHIPLPSDEAWRERWGAGPSYWARLTQAWACLGALYLDESEQWPGSKRREVLLRLLFGPEDWCVDAAAFALYTSALVNPGQRPDVAAAIGARYLHSSLALGRRPTELHKPLAHVVLACPGMDAEVSAYARRMLAWQRASDRDEAPAAPPVGRKDTDVRRWADRLVATCRPSSLPPPSPPRRAWLRRSR